VSGDCRRLLAARLGGELRPAAGLSEPKTGPRHHLLRISLTDRCNLRCAYCMPRDGVTWLSCAETLFTDEILRVLHTAARPPRHSQNPAHRRRTTRLYRNPTSRARNRRHPWHHRPQPDHQRHPARKTGRTARPCRLEARQHQSRYIGYRQIQTFQL
jgi:hypothetical protein